MRWVFRLIGAVVVIAAIAIGGLFFLPGERIARIAADQLSKATGRTVTLSGEARISLYPVLGIATGAVEIANAEWSEAGPMLRAESLRIGVAPAALLDGDIRLTDLEATGPVVRLERAADGRVNWDLRGEAAKAAQTSDASASGTALTLDRARITDGRLVHTDHATGAVTELTDLDLGLRWPAYEGPVDFDAAFARGGGRVSVTGTLDAADRFIDGEVTAVALTVEAAGGRATIDGRAGLPPQLQGRLDLELPDTGAFLAALGMGAVELPQGIGQSLGGSTDLTLTEDLALSLRGLDLDLGGNRIEGAADIDLAGAKPRVTAQIDAGALDLSALAGRKDGGGTGGGTGNGTGGWSTTPIDAGALSLAEGALDLRADSVDLGTMQLDRTRTLMTLERARAVFDLRELRVYGGLLTGEFVINNRSGLSVGGDLRAQDVDLEPFLTDAVGVSRFSARGDGRLAFLGVGGSIDAIMKSLSGDGRIETGRGVISGIDLDRLMRKGDVSGGTTIFDAMSASFTMEGGTLRNDDLVMRLPLIRAEGTGRIGLGARDIDYLFTPVLLEGETSRGLAIPVRIRGSWDNPKIRPDLERAIDLNLDAERDALEQEAEDRLERELRDRLGVTPGEGQSLEDATKEKIEDRAKRELRKLFE